MKLKSVSHTCNLFAQIFDFRKCTEFLLMLILNPQDFLQNRSLETILICIVVVCFPHNNIASIHLCDECTRSNAPNVCHRLRSSGFSPAHWHVYEMHPGAITFPPEAGFFVESLSTGPSASRNTFAVSTITDGYARAREPQLLPALTKG